MDGFQEVCEKKYMHIFFLENFFMIFPKWFMILYVFKVIINVFGLLSQL